MPIILKWAAGLLMFCIVIMSIQWNMITHYRDRAKNLEQTIAQLEHDAVILQNNYNDAREKARDSLLNSNKEVDTILSANVPKDCQEAIDWGISQAKEFN